MRLSNAKWAGPVSALQWVPLTAYAADGKPAACSKGQAVQWVCGIVSGVEGIVYGPGIASDAFRFVYRKTGGMV